MCGRGGFKGCGVENQKGGTEVVGGDFESSGDWAFGIAVGVRGCAVLGAGYSAKLQKWQAPRRAGESGAGLHRTACGRKKVARLDRPALLKGLEPPLSLFFMNTDMGTVVPVVHFTTVLLLSSSPICRRCRSSLTEPVGSNGRNV